MTQGLAVGCGQRSLCDVQVVLGVVTHRAEVNVLQERKGFKS